MVAAGDVVGVVLWQAVRPVQVVRSREGEQGGRLRALGRGVGQLVRLLRKFNRSQRGRTLSHPPEQGFLRASLKRENVVGTMAHSPAGDNDDNEDKSEEKSSNGGSNHDQERKAIFKWIVSKGINI